MSQPTVIGKPCIEDRAEGLRRNDVYDTKAEVNYFQYSH
jgi:hypothetical protein